MFTITLRQLHYARIIAEEGHFGRAATRCHVTQPALSQQIKLLEERCNAPIFERLGKSVRPTRFGRDFLARATRVMEAARDLESFADMATGHPARPLRFGLIPTVAPYLLADILPAIAESVPTVTLAVSEGKTDRLIAALQDGEVDFALVATPPPKAGFVSRTLFADPFVLAAPRGTVPEGPVDPVDLPRDRLLLLEEGHCLRDQAVDACSLPSDLEGRTFAATSLTTILELVANGYGVTLLPAISLKRESGHGGIAIHRLKAPGASRTLRLVWRSASPHGHVYEEIAAVIAEVGQAALRSDWAG
ncbi:hydrogen peroxide-inducible genes activator [Pelagibacterium montanilacus]|uniref:hydrogen peroxide-inducible genes activator n=1 Tax=Pelagibacterium montanilacus TaxID=2185280 RepID=UPI000F8DD06B|nr:hydrogen peroxide-inducible genes activator [Pelagibacterium montanilacus]